MSDSGEKRSQSGQKLGLIGIGIHLSPQDEHDDELYDHHLGFFEDIYLRFPSGSFALYGPNGVGKSRVLQAIKEALGGKGERQHRTDAFYRYSRERFRREAFGYLQDRRQRWGANPAPLPNDLADGIAADGLLCIRRGRGIRPQYAYSVAQDSLNPAVRQATSKLMAEIQRPFNDPDYMLEHFPDLVEEAGEWEMLVPEEGSSAEGPWVDRPDIRDLLRQMTWLSYVELSEGHGLTPQRVCSRNEPLIGEWDHFGRFIEIDRPAWAPWPLEWMLEPPLEAWSDRVEPSVIDVDEITADPVEILRGMPFDEVESTWNERDTQSGAICAIANEILGRLLANSPRIRSSLNSYGITESPPVGTAPVWRVFDPYSDLFTEGLDHLSSTQLRWTRLALVLAKKIHSGGPLRTVLCDEPELGLPPHAQRHLSRGIASLTDDFGIQFILATHSGAILADPRFSLFKVGRRPDRDNRKNSRVALTEVGPGERSRLQRAGVPVSEMLHLYRVILLVEGLHDLWVLDEIIGPELDEAQVKVVPVHGAKQAARLFASEAGLLFEHVPEAKFVIAVDGSKQDLLAEMLATAQVPRQGSDSLQELDHLMRSADASDEAKVMHTLLRRAIETDRLDDIGGLFGFKERDIIEYLEPAVFGLDCTWPELRAQHQERLDNKQGTARDFKKWLELAHNASFDEATIRSAVPQDSIPGEVLMLLDLCRSAAASQGLR